MKIQGDALLSIPGLSGKKEEEAGNRAIWYFLGINPDQLDKEAGDKSVFRVNRREIVFRRSSGCESLRSCYTKLQTRCGWYAADWLSQTSTPPTVFIIGDC